MSLEKMRMILECKGGTVRQSKINDGRRSMYSQFDKDVSYNPDFYLWEYGILEKEMKHIPIRTFNEKFSAANGLTIEFNTLIDVPVSVGDVLYNSSADIFWLCTEYYNRDDILGAGKLTRCNYRIKWQDCNADIFEYPVFEINSTQYNSGESGDKTMTLGSSQHLITITADENTLRLDHDKRIFWDRNTARPTAFKITQNDTTSMNYGKGLLKITITEDQYKPETDSIENWLCDYFEVSPITILYSGGANIRLGGNKELTVNAEGNIQWSVEGDITAELTAYGNKAKIACPFKPEYIGKEIIIKASAGEKYGVCKLKITGGI